MRVLIVHQAVGAEEPSDAADVLVQRDAVAGALEALGHTVQARAVTLDLAALDRGLAEVGPDLVFNLTEALGGTDRLMPLVPMLVEARGLALTGCPAACILASTDKVAAKHRLRAMGLPTPAFHAPGGTPAFDVGAPVVLKAIWEHASFGLDARSIVTYEGATQLEAQLAQREAETGAPHFAEAFVDGREFNVSLLEVQGEVRVLPPAEIDFSGMAPGAPRIVGYAAKWVDDSAESRNTPRTFDFPASDRALLERVEDVARRTWAAFGARGYARVDLRVGTHGPQVLELNANPCLSLDAGFAAAAGRAGYDYPAMITTLCRAALSRRTR